MAAMIEYESSTWVQTMNLSCNNRGLVAKPSLLKVLRRYAIATIKLGERLIGNKSRG